MSSNDKGGSQPKQDRGNLSEELIKSIPKHEPPKPGNMTRNTFPPPPNPDKGEKEKK